MQQNDIFVIFVIIFIFVFFSAWTARTGTGRPWSTSARTWTSTVLPPEYGLVLPPEHGLVLLPEHGP